MADKQLESTRAAAAFQKAWFEDLRRRVFTDRQPYALVQADVPFELFQLLDMPAVSNQWWAAIVAAKRLAPAYLDAMNADGFHRGLCRYCSLGFASTRYAHVQAPPWGGLPTPRLLCARLTCDCVGRVFSLWAEAFRTEVFELEHPGATDLPPRWWEPARHRWRELVEPDRLACVQANLQSLITRLEQITGRTFDPEGLRSVMAATNTQEEIFDEVRSLICAAPRVPVRMTEQIANVMATQWVRGSDWALAHARAFRDEVRARVDAGEGVCERERVRLMWVGAGLWHDTDFYTAFEESHGAVFVWSMYLAFGPDGYIRYGLEDPFAALASRMASFNEYLHSPVGARMDRPAGEGPSRGRGTRASTARHAASRHRTPLHRSRARARRDLRAPGRSGRRGRPRLGSREGAHGRHRVSRRKGAVSVTTSAETGVRVWVVPFMATVFAMFTLQLSNLGFSPLLPSIQHEFGMSYTQLGLFTGMYGLLALALSVPAGFAAKTFGERRVLAIGLIGVAAGSGVLREAVGFASALTGRALTITGYRFAFVSVLVAVAVTAPPSLRGRTMGIVGAVSSLASVIGSPLGGRLVAEFGWRTAIIGYGGMALLGALVFASLYRASAGGVHVDAHGAHVHGSERGASPSARSAFRTPVVWMLALIVGLGGFGQFTVTNFVPSVARGVFGLDAAAAGVIISTGYLCAIVVNLIVGYLTDRFDKVRVLAAVFVILAVASAALASTDLGVFRVATAAVLGLGFTAANQLYGLAGSVMPRHEAGNAMGVVSLGAGLFGFFGPQMLGILRDWTGTFAAGFYMCAIADVLTLGLLLWLSRLMRRARTVTPSRSLAS